MRKYLLFLLLCTASFTKAQERTQSHTSPTHLQGYTQGNWLIGLQAGYSKGLLLDRNLTTQAYGGYFVANNVLVGLSAVGSQEWHNSIRDRSYFIGPMVRCQLTRTRFSPFLVASYQIGQRTLLGVESQTITQVVSTSSGPVTVTSGSTIRGSGRPERLYSRSFGAGLSISLTALLRVDIALDWQDRVDLIDSRIRLDDGLWQPRLGVNYSIINKQ